MKELSSINEKLRAELSEKERNISTLQLTVSSLESPAMHGFHEAPGPLLDLPGQDQASAAETVHRITRQLIADCDQLQAVRDSLAQVYTCEKRYGNFFLKR